MKSARKWIRPANRASQCMTLFVRETTPKRCNHSTVTNNNNNGDKKRACFKRYQSVCDVLFNVIRLFCIFGWLIASPCAHSPKNWLNVVDSLIKLHLKNAPPDSGLSAGIWIIETLAKPCWRSRLSPSHSQIWNVINQQTVMGIIGALIFMRHIGWLKWAAADKLVATNSPISFDKFGFEVGEHLAPPLFDFN